VDGLFDYRLELKTPDGYNFSHMGGANLDLDGFIGKEINVGIELADTRGGIREINGLVTESRFLREEGRHAFYELRLRPWLYLADLTRDCKIFQDLTVVELLDELLSEYGFPVEKRLVGDYPKRDYQTQYNETDFGFFVRLCEEWGISYFFEHSGKAHRLVLTDDMSAWRRNPNERYQVVMFHLAGEQAEEEYIDALVPLRRIASGAYQSREYDYTRPKADLTVEQTHPRDTAANDFEVFAWHGLESMASHYAQPKAGPEQATNEAVTEGDKLALLRMQALRSPGWRARGGGNLRGMVPGCVFRLREHPSVRANIDYLILKTTLLVEEVAEETQGAGSGAKAMVMKAVSSAEGLREQTWNVRVDFELHPAQEVYRVMPGRKKPVVPGPEVALVVGPAGEDIWTDELGRIKVQFPWDRYGEENENSSCWLRVSSPWAGNQLGGVHLPRIGQEVLVSYVGGDPDLPVCTGRVYNQDNLPPWRLPSQQALSGFRSRELVKGGGNAASGQSNALILDDTEGRIQAKLRSDYLGSELSLGYVTRVEDNEGRKDGRGEGFDLRTDGHGVVRSGSGLYLTTELRLNAQGAMKEMEETVNRLEQAKGQQETLAEVADTFGADFGEQEKVAKDLEGANGKIRGEGETDESAGKFPEFSEGHLVVSSAHGNHLSSRSMTHIAAGDHLALTSGEHLSLSVGKRWLASVTDGLRFFVRQAGMKLIAAADDIDIKSLKNNLNLLAKLELSQTANRITLKAKEEILLVGGGSYIRIKGGNIENGTDGSWKVHAASTSLEGPKSLSASLPSLPKVGEGQVDLFSHYTKPYGLKNSSYKVIDALGKTVEGTLDSEGRGVASGLAMGAVKVFFGEEPTDTWDMVASNNGEPEWPPRELQESADVGGQNSFESLSGAAKAALDGAMKAAGEIGQNLRQISQLAPNVSSLSQILPMGGDLGKLGDMGGMLNDGIGSLSGVLDNSGAGNVLTSVFQGEEALPGSLPVPLIPGKGCFI
jgi:type VI secretion system secreted protein VgrG